MQLPFPLPHRPTLVLAMSLAIASSSIASPQEEALIALASGQESAAVGVLSLTEC